MKEASQRSGRVVAGIDDGRQYYVVQSSHENTTAIRGGSENDFVTEVARWFCGYEPLVDAVIVAFPDGKEIELDLRATGDDKQGDDVQLAREERAPHDWSQYLTNLCPFHSHERKLAALAKLIHGPATTMDETWAVLGPLYHALSEEDRALVLHWCCVWTAEKG